MAVVRFSDRPPSVHEAPLREPSEEDFFEKYLRNFQDPPSFAEPCDLEDLPRLPSFRTPYEPEEPIQFPKLDLPPASALQLPDGKNDGLRSSQWRLEMEAMVPHERQSMMAESEYGPAPTLEFPEPRQAVEEHVVPALKLPLPPPPPPPPILSHTDVFQEAVELPLGVSNLQVSGSQETIYPPPQPVLTEHSNLVLEDESLPPPSWCGLWNLNCKEGKCAAAKKDDSDKCVRCRKALDSFMDHQCPKCSASFCVKCVARFPLNWFRCKCGDQEANQAVLRKNLWMIKAYHTTYQAFNSLGASLSSLSSWMPCKNQETAQSLKDSTITQLHGGQMPPDMVVPGDRTRLPISFAGQDEVQIPMPKRKKAYRPGNMPLPPPPPPPPHGPSELPHLLGRHTAGIIPMNYYETDPFQTRLPGDMSE